MKSLKLEKEDSTPDGLAPWYGRERPPHLETALEGFVPPKL